MNRPGIIIRNTFEHLTDEDLSGCGTIYGELYYCNEHWQSVFRKRNLDFIPIVSGYLGSKTKSTKITELEFASSRAFEGVLYFPDSKNIKFKEVGGLSDEIRAAASGLSSRNSVFFLPVDYYEESEIKEILEIVSELPSKIMLYFEDAIPQADSIRKLAGMLQSGPEENRIICAFADRAMYLKAQSVLAETGIADAAYYA